VVMVSGASIQEAQAANSRDEIYATIQSNFQGITVPGKSAATNPLSRADIPNRINDVASQINPSSNLPVYLQDINGNPVRFDDSRGIHFLNYVKVMIQTERS